MNFVYGFGRWFTVRGGFLIALALIVFTVYLGILGFYSATFDTGEPRSWFDATYKGISLLAIQTGNVPVPASNWVLQVARFSGMLFWASTILTILVKIFRERVHRAIVRCFANKHVIVAGLGEHGVRLVAALRARKRSVVVLEPNRLHPAVEECQRIGAIVLFGETDDPNLLREANLKWATEFLALFCDERSSVRSATAAYELLCLEKATASRPPVRCVLRIIEPGLLDVIRRHKIKTDSNDRIQLEILNSHEIAATTMVREAVANSAHGKLDRILVLGLGTYHRLGEMVILRAIKDRLIQNLGATDTQLSIHLYDKDAEKWFKNFTSRYPFDDKVAQFELVDDCWARKVGAVKLRKDYDAAFICIADEGQATGQAVMLRRDVLLAGQPIMVRVSNSKTGFGELLGKELSGWGENLHAVGLEDSLFDTDTATKPELELRAQTIHHDYRADKRMALASAGTEPEKAAILGAEANKPWIALDEKNRKQNRDLANMYEAYLRLIGGKKRRGFRIEFAPDRFEKLGASSESLTAEEFEELEKREHERWLKLKLQPGESLDEGRKRTGNAYIRPFDDLTDDQRAFNRKFVRRIPMILALADYALVEA